MINLGYLEFPNRNEADEKYTPRYAVLPIIKYLPKGKIVWCPFDTENSEFVIALKENGFEVIFSHICTGQDFFEYEPNRWDIIVSNPPFSGKRQVFERCLAFGKPFALLMSNLWLNDTSPSRLFAKRDLQLLAFDKRIQFNEANKIPFSSGYFCCDLLPKQIIFEKLTPDKIRSRMYAEMEKMFGRE